MSKEALNLEEFMDRVQDDKELFFELLDIFVDDFQVKRKELEDAIAKEDSEAVEHVAHFLKGSCGNISAESLRAFFSDLEEKGKANDLEGAKESMNGLGLQFDELVKYIGELRERLQ